MQESYSASGVPFSILDTLRSQMNGGVFKSKKNMEKAKTSGGVKSKNQFTKDRKLVLEAWKLFRKDVKLVKDKYLKDKIRKVERVFKSKQYGGKLDEYGNEVDEVGEDGNGINTIEDEKLTNKEDTETFENVKSAVEEPSSDEPSVQELNRSVKELKESLLNLRANMSAVLDKLGLDKDKVSIETVKAALDNISKFVDKCSNNSESTLSGGKSKSKSKSKKVKNGGNIIQGQYAINDIYSPEKGSSVTVGGKNKGVSVRRFKKGGEYAACNNTTTFTNVTGSDSSYNLLNNDPPFNSQYALVPPELTPSSAETSTSIFTSTPDTSVAPMTAPMYAPMTAPMTAPMDSYQSSPVTSGGGKKKSKNSKKGGNFGLPGDLHNLLSPSTLTPENVATSGGSRKKSSSGRKVKK